MIRLLIFVFLCYCEAFNLTILHNNDVHSHFVEFNTNAGRCTEKLATEKECYGGFARQVTMVKKVRANEENVLLLNAGDFYQGTVWYTLHRWRVVADLVNQLNLDAMSLGNHEFDDGLEGLLPFLENVNTTVLACNVNATKVPEFGELIRPSIVIDVAGEKIGVIGYLTPDTKFLSSPGDLEFEDEVQCIKREAEKLTRVENLTKIIAVGHSGFKVDQMIAREVPEVDIVIGGHTNTFLYTGKKPSVEEPQGPYPVVVEREDGSLALVVQDFAFGKYMGYLQVEFDNQGRIQNWGGNPMLLNASVPEDLETLELLKPYEEDVALRSKWTIGKTNVLLQGGASVCRMGECNIGNLITDGCLDYIIKNPTEKGWSFVAVAIWNSGAIRSSIDERINEGNITLEDVLAVAPFGNTLDIVTLKGKHLREILEHSVKNYDADGTDTAGAFLQVSGLRLTYDVSKPPGSRLIEASIRCADCRVPHFEPLNDEGIYTVAMNSFIVKGGDGYDMIEKNAISHKPTDIVDIDILIKYAEKYSPITTGLEDRISLISSKNIPKESRSETSASSTIEEYEEILKSIFDEKISPHLTEILGIPSLRETGRNRLATNAVDYKMAYDMPTASGIYEEQRSREVTTNSILNGKTTDGFTLTSHIPILTDSPEE
ncbi:snake venom 5'-nucleotidase-like [Stegodyphus dumicola]|uniref:snake venom 5'-nucleotidase-like n=1 Tax=Stegodyphus dumicola TaxID=202533 RepID=UPI0015ADE231|nr:snake venom 5'-nucleotidase-like [Stegodyphus dumicola]